MGEVYYVYLTMGIGTNWNKLEQSTQSISWDANICFTSEKLLQIEAIKGSQGSPGSLYNVNSWLRFGHFGMCLLTDGLLKRIPYVPTFSDHSKLWYHASSHPQRCVIIQQALKQN